MGQNAEDGEPFDACPDTLTTHLASPAAKEAKGESIWIDCNGRPEEPEPGTRRGHRLPLTIGGNPGRAQADGPAGAHGVPRLLSRGEARQEGQTRPRPIRGASPVREEAADFIFLVKSGLLRHAFS